MTILPEHWNFSISREDLILFLEMDGWTRLEHPNLNYDVFKTCEDEPITLAINKHLEYFNKDVKLYAEAIQNYKNLSSITAVTIEIARSTNDLFFSKLSTSKNSFIPLETASNAISSNSSILKRIAKIEKDKQILDNQKGETLSQITRRIQLGHTYKGSFGISIISPLPKNTAVPLFDKETTGSDSEIQLPIQRKVFQRLYTIFNRSALSVTHNSVDPLVENHEDGPDSRICGDILTFWKNRMDYDISFKPQWSRQYPMDESYNGDILLSPASIPFLKTAQKILFREEEPTRVAISGKISDLHRDVIGLEDQRQRYITIVWDTGSTSKKVKIQLTPDLYDIAIDAHDRDIPISVIGNLKKGAPYYRLFSPDSFRLL